MEWLEFQYSKPVPPKAKALTLQRGKQKTRPSLTASVRDARVRTVCVWPRVRAASPASFRFRASLPKPKVHLRLAELQGPASLELLLLPAQLPGVGGTLTVRRSAHTLLPNPQVRRVLARNRAQKKKINGGQSRRSSE